MRLNIRVGSVLTTKFNGIKEINLKIKNKN